jgi:ABC-2 type transport system permease protein
VSDVALRTRPSGSRLRSYARAFGGLLLRDARVLVREIVPFVLRTVMNPLLFVFVFAYVFPTIGQGFSGGAPDVSFATILVPGLVAVAVVFQGISAVALPLVNEFGRTREIEDRVMAPLPVGAVAVEKIVFGALQSVVAAAMVFPLVYLVPATDVSVNFARWPLLGLVVVLSSLTAGALGLAVGTVVRPQQVPLIFSILVIPITFLGCVYYPWASLGSIRWLQIAVLVNPLVYMSEGLRASLTPQLPHMPVPAFLGAITLSLTLLSTLGVRAFLGRVRS